MVIAYLADPTDACAGLPDALRAAGHIVRVTAPMEAALDGDSTPDAVLCRGLVPPPNVIHYAMAGHHGCAIALLDPEMLPDWNPEAGYSDFVVAPYRSDEVLARLALRRFRQRDGATEVIRSGLFVMDVDNYTLWADHERIALTYKEYELLRFLITHPGRVFSREALLRHVWGYDYYGGSRTIDVHIRRIRSKLPAAAAACLETVHQVGYRYAGHRHG